MRSPSFTNKTNMKGKKTLKMKCGCCMMINLKDNYIKSLAKKELRLAKYSITCD